MQITFRPFLLRLFFAGESTIPVYQRVAWGHISDRHQLRSELSESQSKRWQSSAAAFPGDHSKNEWFLQKKTAPPIDGGATLKDVIITPFIAKASYLLFLGFYHFQFPFQAPLKNTPFCSILHSVRIKWPFFRNPSLYKP
jgi:hypothetical protein